MASAAGVPGIQRLLIGDLVVGQKVEVVLRVRFPDMPEGAHTTAFFTDRDGVLKADGCTLAWTHDSHAANDAQLRNRDVDRAVAAIHAARARTEAVRLNRVGDFDGARHALRGVARRIDGYAGSDAALQELSAQLVAELAAFSAPMPELRPQACPLPLLEHPALARYRRPGTAIETSDKDFADEPSELGEVA